jgi:hypothetical protein
MNLAWARNLGGQPWRGFGLGVWLRPIHLAFAASRAVRGFPLTLWADLISAKVLVWIATFASEGTLSPDTHDYFFDRYSRLADRHRRLGHRGMARRLDASAEEHRLPGGDGEPPYAAAMALPIPIPNVFVDAVSRNRLDPPRVHSDPAPPPAQ